MQLFLYILLAILILLLMVTIHEFGHYTFGKLLGFEIDEFAVGFGPKLLSYKSKKGMIWSLRILPLGGFCAFYGEDELSESPTDGAAKNAKPLESAENEAEVKTSISADSISIKTTENQPSASHSDEHNFVNENSENGLQVAVGGAQATLGNTRVAFEKQPPWKRIIVLFGGVTFNFVSAIIFSLIFICAAGFTAPQVTKLYANESGVYANEIKVGDVITSVNGKEVSVMDDFKTLASTVNSDETAQITVLREGRFVDISLKKQQITYVDDYGETQTYYGFGFSSTNSYQSVDFLYGLKYCVPYTAKLSWSILSSFGQLITGRVPITQLSGPIGTIGIMAQVSLVDWRNILLLLPLIASNLAIFNLFPIPSLDGMKIIFTSVEWVRKKPINRKVEGIMNIVGMCVLLLFVIIVDIIGFIVR